MRILVLLAISIVISIVGYGQNPREFEVQEGDTTFVMKRYVFGLLMAGPNRDQDSVKTAEIQKGHIAHLNKMADEGKILVAGPFENGGEYRGVLVFDVETELEAQELAKQDPAIKAGRLILKTIPWWTAKGTCLD